MAVHIRAKGNCPVCGKPFKEFRNLGLVCPEHSTTPKRFFLDTWWKGKRIKIYSSLSGNPLRSYEDARDEQGAIEIAIKNKTFDPDRYSNQKQSLFLCPTLLDRFLTAKQKTIAPSYQAHYNRYVSILREHLSTTDVREIRKNDLTLLKEALEERFVTPGEWKEKTLKNCMDVMKTFLNYVRDEWELIPLVPAFPVVDTVEPSPKWVHSNDRVDLFQSVADEDKPIVGFLFLHGCRPGEARALKCKDIDLEAQELNIHATFSDEVYRERRKGKKAKPLIIPIHPEAFEYLKARKLSALSEAWVFPNPRTGEHYTKSAMTRLWNHVRRVLGITDKEIRLYDASRHSFASELINLGTPLYTVSKLLGHSNTKTTEKYTHADMGHLRTEIGKVSLKVVEIKKRKASDE